MSNIDSNQPAHLHKKNVLKFWTLYSIPFWPKLCFYAVVSWNGKQRRPWSDCSFRSSLIWVCTVCICHFVRHFGVGNFWTFTVIWSGSSLSSWRNFSSLAIQSAHAQRYCSQDSKYPHNIFQLCGYSLGALCRGTSNKYSQHMCKVLLMIIHNICFHQAIRTLHFNTYLFMPYL